MRKALHLGFAVITVVAVTGCSDDETTIVRTAVPTATDVADPTATPSPGVTESGTPTDTPELETPTATPPASPPPTEPESTPTPTATGTPAGTAPGPMISYFGISAADDRIVESIGSDSAGRPIFVRELGTGLSLIVEAQPGPDGRSVGREAFEQVGLPDLQMLVSRPLGDGSPAVCDFEVNGPSGGVPAIDPPVFSSDSVTVAAINDLGCRVNDGTGLPVARTASEQACTRFESGQFGFVEPRSQVQFCLPIARAWAFPKGDTIVTARTRSVLGSIGTVRQIVVRVLRELTPLPTLPPETPAPTPTPVPPMITYLGIAAADDAIVPFNSVDDDGRPVFTRLIGHAFSLVVEAAPAPGGRPVGTNAFSPDGLLPDLQILVQRDLGDGAPAVCDVDTDNEIFGGVPGTDPLEFSPAVAPAVNDLGCRVNDGTGAPLGRTPDSPCTRDEFGNFAFVDERSTIQFCLPIAKAWQYPLDDTITAARVRGIDGGVSESEEIVIRVGEGREDCPTGGPGLRVFSIDRNDSALAVDAVPGDQSSEWVSTPGLLCAGPSDDGVYPLTLLEDLNFGFRTPDGSVVCAQLKAEGSSGILDCAGSEAHGVRQESNGADGSMDIAVGLGDPAGSGAASLALPIGFLLPGSSASPRDCLGLDLTNTLDLGITTGTAEAEVINPMQGGTVSIAMRGENFDCDGWRTEDGPGTFLMPIGSTVDSPVGDTATIFVLDD